MVKAPGGRNQRLYQIWRGMRWRCSPPSKEGQLKPYFKKGIRVCAGWSTYDPFCVWAMANGYRDDLSIDRVDNDGDYSPVNCRWATPTQQANNTSRTILFEIDGQTLSLAQVARHVGVNYGSLVSLHCKQGMPLEAAVSRLKGLVEHRSPTPDSRRALARRILAESVGPGTKAHEALTSGQMFGSTGAVSLRQALEAMERYARELAL